jgi:hypothetical protein
MLIPATRHDDADEDSAMRCTERKIAKAESVYGTV